MNNVSVQHATCECIGTLENSQTDGALCVLATVYSGVLLCTVCLICDSADASNIDEELLAMAKTTNVMQVHWTWCCIVCCRCVQE
jgi:hypothetical protein